MRYVITCTFLKKRKLLQVQLMKQKEIVRGKKLTDAGVFPIRLQHGEL